MICRSSWTDTPEIKEQRASGKHVEKVDAKKEVEAREIRKRNKQMEEIVIEHNKKKKRDKSLVEIHQEELKKKKEKEVWRYGFYCYTLALMGMFWV